MIGPFHDFTCELQNVECVANMQAFWIYKWDAFKLWLVCVKRMYIHKYILFKKSFIKFLLQIFTIKNLTEFANRISCIIFRIRVLKYLIHYISRIRRAACTHY